MTSDSPPKMCDGRSSADWKPNPVALVATVVTRKISVQPARRRFAMRPPTTTPPARMPTTLRRTWMSVNVAMGKANQKGG